MKKARRRSNAALASGLRATPSAYSVITPVMQLFRTAPQAVSVHKYLLTNVLT
jgi:hypothetical protein